MEIKSENEIKMIEMNRVRKTKQGLRIGWNNAYFQALFDQILKLFLVSSY